MKPTEFGEIVNALGWSQRETAERLGVSSAAVSRWLNGSRPIPEPVSRLLTLLARRRASGVKRVGK